MDRLKHRFLALFAQSIYCQTRATILSVISWTPLEKEDS